MRVTASLSGKRKNLVVLEFDRELPVFPAISMFFARYQFLFDRQDDLHQFATVMAHQNRGALAIERCPEGGFQHVFHEFLNDLIVVPGLIGIVSANRYIVSFMIGKLFDFDSISHQVAQIFQRHFYPDDLIDLEISRPTERVSTAHQ